MTTATHRALILRELRNSSRTTRQLRAMDIMGVSAWICELRQRSAEIHAGLAYWTDSEGRVCRQARYTLMSLNKFLG